MITGRLEILNWNYNFMQVGGEIIYFSDIDKNTVREFWGKQVIVEIEIQNTCAYMKSIKEIK